MFQVHLSQVEVKFESIKTESGLSLEVFESKFKPL